MNIDFSFHPNAQDVKLLKDLLERAKDVVITCHVSPDGDALGSSLGLMHVLKSIFPHNRVTVITPDAPPKQLWFMPGFDEVVPASYDYSKAALMMRKADLVVCLDFNEFKRVDRLSAILEQCEGKRVIIDHHLAPGIPASVSFSYPNISSTSAILYMLLCKMGWHSHITLEAAECICTGMITDTGNFSYNSLDPDLYLILAQMVNMGVNKDRLARIAINVASESKIRICAYGTLNMNLLPRHHAAIITLSQRELAEFDYVKGDTEGLVNEPLRLDDVTYSVFLREDPDQRVKVSMRSKGDFPVNKICADHFGGGGHKNAAGGEFTGTLSEALDKLLSVMPEYDALIIN